MLTPSIQYIHSDNEDTKNDLGLYRCPFRQPSFRFVLHPSSCFPLGDSYLTSDVTGEWWRSGGRNYSVPTGRPLWLKEVESRLVCGPGPKSPRLPPLHRVWIPRFEVEDRVSFFHSTFSTLSSPLDVTDYGTWFDDTHFYMHIYRWRSDILQTPQGTIGLWCIPCP